MQQTAIYIAIINIIIIANICKIKIIGLVLVVVLVVAPAAEPICPCTSGYYKNRHPC